MNNAKHLPVARLDNGAAIVSNRTLTAVISVALLAICCTPPAKADLFLNFSADTTTVTCDNSTAAGVSHCAAVGILTTLDGNSMTLSAGSITVGGYKIASLDLITNVPGQPTLSGVTNTILADNVSDSGNLTVNFAAYNFVPVSPQMTLQADQALAIGAAVAGDQALFQAWARPDDSPTIPGGGLGGVATSTSPCTVTVSLNNCTVSTIGPVFSPTGNYALTGQQVISEHINSDNAFAGSSEATPVVSAVPEPASVLMLGTVLMGVGVAVLKKRKL